MSNPNDDYVIPTFTGEVWVSVRVTYTDHGCADQSTLEQEAVADVQKAIENLGGVYAELEDSDLTITNEEEDFMSRADRLYEEANDK
tara:strand:+ start:2013 stop:2273 length:261 start_codon:yes stop_codon:yes gene_type:complete